MKDFLGPWCEHLLRVRSRICGLSHYGRGQPRVEGPDAAAWAVGPKPLMSGVKTEDEGLFVVQHKYWQEPMQRALAAEVGKAQG